MIWIALISLVALIVVALIVAATVVAVAFLMSRNTEQTIKALQPPPPPELTAEERQAFLDPYSTRPLHDVLPLWERAETPADPDTLRAEAIERERDADTPPTPTPAWEGPGSL